MAFVDGRIKMVHLNIPWKQFRNSKIKIKIEGFALLLRTDRQNFIGYVKKSEADFKRDLLNRLKQEFINQFQQNQTGWQAFLMKEIIDKIDLEVSDFAVYFLVDDVVESKCLVLHVDELKVEESTDFKELKNMSAGWVRLLSFSLTGPLNAKTNKEDLNFFRKARASAECFMSAAGLSAQKFKDHTSQSISLNCQIKKLTFEVSHKQMSLLVDLMDITDLVKYVRNLSGSNEVGLQIRDPQISTQLFRYRMLRRLIRYGRRKYRREFGYLDKLKFFKIGMQLMLCGLTETGDKHRLHENDKVVWGNNDMGVRKFIEKTTQMAESLHSEDIINVFELAKKGLEIPTNRELFYKERVLNYGKHNSKLFNFFKTTSKSNTFTEKVQWQVSSQKTPINNYSDAYRTTETDNAINKQPYAVEQMSQFPEQQPKPASVKRQSPDTPKRVKNSNAFILTINTLTVNFINSKEVLFSVIGEGLSVDSANDHDCIQLKKCFIVENGISKSLSDNFVFKADRNQSDQCVRIQWGRISIETNTHLMSKLFFVVSHPFFKRQNVVKKQKKSPLNFRFTAEFGCSVMISDSFSFENGFKLSCLRIDYGSVKDEVVVEGLQVVHLSNKSSAKEETQVLLPVKLQISFSNGIEVTKLDSLQVSWSSEAQSSWELLSALAGYLQNDFLVGRTNLADNDNENKSAHSLSPEVTRKNSDGTV